MKFNSSHNTFTNMKKIENSSESDKKNNESTSYFFKVFILLLLVVQNSSHALTMRYSRIQHSSDETYIASTAVLTGELVKLVLSFIFCLISDYKFNCWRLLSTFKAELFDLDFIKLTVPAFLYVVQNNLTFMATSNLPAEIYQVLSNLKIISTAIFTVIVLRRPQNIPQWVAITALTLGIGCVQVSQSKGDNSNSEHKNMLFGLICVTAAAIISGFAGVYFELVLKSSNTSIWIRNFQLALISLFISAFGVIANDYNEIKTKGFFFQYDSIVITVILIGAAGGLIVAIVIKFLDNISKGFASGSSIVLSCFVSRYYFSNESVINLMFISGTGLVCFSIIGYSVASQLKTHSANTISNKEKLGSTFYDTERGIKN